MINRDDMLELTRRMNLQRAHFTRVAGAYIDEDGDFAGSYNRAFGDLSADDRKKQLSLAKVIPFAGTNSELKECRFPDSSATAKSMWQLLMGIRSCGLKNDALLDTFYDIIMEKYHPGHAYSILLYHGIYDIPRKAADGSRLGESENVYEYIICALAPIDENYESAKPEAGFLFPAYADQCADLDHIDEYGGRGLSFML